MTETTTDGYINSTKTNDVGFNGMLSAFLDELRASGHTDSFIHDSERRILHVTELVGRFQDFDPRNADAGTIVWLNEILSDRSERTRREYVRSYGRFLNFITGSPIYHERACYNKSSGYFMFTGPTAKSFEDDLARYVENLKSFDIPESTVRTQEKHVRHCLKMMVDRFGRVDLGAIDSDTFDELGRMMENLTEHRRNAYLSSFGRFLGFIDGRNPFREVRGSMVMRDYPAYLRNKVEQSRFKEELVSFLEWMRAAGLKEITMRNKLAAIHACEVRLERIRPGFSLDSVDHNDLIALRMDMANLKESTAKQFIYQFGAFIGRTTGFNPYSDCRIMWNYVEPERTFIHEAEWLALWQEANVEERLIIALAGGMGLRRAEIASIRLSDIQGDRIRIRGKGHGPEGKVVIMNLSASVKGIIQEYMAHRQRIIEVFGDRSEDHLLVKSAIFAGEYMIPDNVGEVVYRLAKRCGISASTHTLRRLYATTLFKSGADINIVRLMMRHSNVNTTLRCYIEADTEKCLKAQNSLENVLFL